MKESYSEDLASHAGPEPYAGDGNISGVAWARGTRRPAIELRYHLFRAPKSYGGTKATSVASLLARRGPGTAESETLSMCGNSKRENREILSASVRGLESVAMTQPRGTIDERHGRKGRYGRR